MSFRYSSRAAHVAAFGFVALLSAPAFAACGAAPTSATTDSLLRLNATGAWSGAVEDAGSAQTGDFVYDGTNNVPAFCNGTSWVDVAAAGGNTTLNGISAATANQAGIANAAYTIVWNWDTLAGGSALTLSSVSTAAAGERAEDAEYRSHRHERHLGADDLRRIISNTHAGTTSSEVGLYAVATSGTTSNIGIEGSSMARHTGGCRRLRRFHRHQRLELWRLCGLTPARNGLRRLGTNSASGGIAIEGGPIPARR